MATKPPVPFLPRCTLSVWPKIIPTLLRNLQRGKYLSFLRLPGPCGDCLQPGTTRHPCPRRCLLLVWPQVKANQFGFEGRNVKRASPGRSRCSAALSWRLLLNDIWQSPWESGQALSGKATTDGQAPWRTREMQMKWQRNELSQKPGLEGGFQAREPDTHTAWPLHFYRRGSDFPEAKSKVSSATVRSVLTWPRTLFPSGFKPADSCLAHHVLTLNELYPSGCRASTALKCLQRDWRILNICTHPASHPKVTHEILNSKVMVLESEWAFGRWEWRLCE